MVSLNINDTATWRAIKRVNVNDVGTWRDCKSVWINDGGVWRKVFQRGVTLLMTEDTDGSTFYGWINNTYGTMTPSNDGNGHTIQELTVKYSPPPSVTRLQLSGFGADPGQGYLNELTNVDTATTITGASATLYQYSAGFAAWNWSGTALFPLTASVNLVLSTG